MQILCKIFGHKYKRYEREDIYNINRIGFKVVEKRGYVCERCGHIIHV